MADADDPPLLCPLCGYPTQAAETTVSASPPMFSAQQARPPLKRRTPPEAPPAVVRVEIGDEAAALREALVRQQSALGDLQAELDAERGATAGAASEAMTMILRLQREKAEAMMEARQFRRYAEDKMSHDAAEMAALEDALAKRDAALMRVQQQTPRRAAASRASTPSRHAGAVNTPRLPAPPSPVASSSGQYPALRCLIDYPPTASEADALDCAQQQQQTPLHRLAHQSGAHNAPTTTPIIRVAPGSGTFLPRQHHYAFSDDDGSSSLDHFCDGRGGFLPSDDDGTSDRVYTVDALQPLEPPEGSCYGSGGTRTPAGGSDCCVPWAAAEDEEVRRLSSRLQALEADRESMRQAIISMGADKAQVMLLKEIAQKLCREAAVPAAAQQSYYRAGSAQQAVTVTVRPPRQRPVTMQRTVVNRQPVHGTSFLAAAVKVIVSFSLFCISYICTNYICIINRKFF
jgi:hypothetical protein